MKTTNNKLRQKYDILQPFLHEKLKRLFLGAEATVRGYGGISEVSRETDVSRRLIAQGIEELKDSSAYNEKKIRKAGGGRKRRTEIDVTLKKN